MRRSFIRHLIAWLILLVTAGAATWVVHRETLHYGFNYDDYHTIRPYTPREVLATFHGSWDAHGDVMAPFYRPQTVAFHALRFELFELNSTAHPDRYRSHVETVGGGPRVNRHEGAGAAGGDAAGSVTCR